MFKRKPRFAVTVVLACCLSTVGTALADTSSARTAEVRAADDVAALVKRLAPPVGDLPGAAQSVFVPADRSAALQARVSGTAHALSLALPVTPGTSSVAAGDGTIVHTGQETDVAVESFELGGARVSTVLKSPKSARTFDYTFDASVTAVVEPDGDVSLRRTAPGRIEQVGTLQAPWARDATGAPVPTWYRAHGNAVTQVIAPAPSAAYPVVADPFWIPALAVVAHFTRHAITQMAARKVSQELVERVVLNGMRTAGKPGSNTSVFSQGSGANRVRVIVDNTTGNIVTVTRG